MLTYKEGARFFKDIPQHKDTTENSYRKQRSDDDVFGDVAVEFMHGRCLLGSLKLFLRAR